MRFWKHKKITGSDITPDEIFMDAKNIPGFRQESFEGVMEKEITPGTPMAMLAVFALVAIVLLGKVAYLDIWQGRELSGKAYNNRLRAITLQSVRGVIYDRNGRELAWNSVLPASGSWVDKNLAALSADGSFEAERIYADLRGVSHVLGYLGYDPRDESSAGNVKVGLAGVEGGYNNLLAGEAGTRLVEVDSKERVTSESVQKEPRDGDNIVLTIDSELEQALFDIIGSVVKDRGFEGGAGVVMDPRSGEILAMTSWPEYNSNTLSEGDPQKINTITSDARNPFFFRAVSGTYAPGSIVKPIMALAALQEGVVDEHTSIFSSGKISVPSPYEPNKYSVFLDWKAHGWVDVRHALAVSSNVYFYTVGGGYENIGGLGVSRIKKYMQMFGLGSKTGIDILREAAGFIPDPEWKSATMPDGIWRVGDTYNLSIGQGWLQVTPLQMARVAAAVGMDGAMPTPHLVREVRNAAGETVDAPSVGGTQNVNIDKKYFQIVREGMQMAASPGGTAQALAGLGINLAGKTGTAEVGKDKVNSWLISFAPYDQPSLALSIVLEKGSVHNLVGAPFAGRQLMEWIQIHRPEYLSGSY